MRRYARARRHVPGTMNGLEAAYAKELASQGHTFLFERIKLKLADNCHYTPDFVVFHVKYGDGGIDFHEVKGFMRDDALVKLKVAATQFPWFTFKLVTRKGGEWQVKEIQPAD